MAQIFSETESLPTSLELPESDDTPVDNEIQNLIPNLLKSVLAVIWADRQDWFFGVDMGVYDRQGQKQQIAIVPDGFLSLNVTRVKGQEGRSSYVLAEVVYNPQYWRRDGHAPLEIYRLGKKGYQLQKKNPFWMPEIGLGIGMERGLIETWERDWLYWYDQDGHRYPIPEEMMNRLQRRLGILATKLAETELELEQERQRAQLEAQRAEQERLEKEQERQRADRAQAELQALRKRLQAEGINLDNF